MPDLTFTAIADHAAFEERLKNVPQTNGVYLWKDTNGTLLYVGKSKNLRDRMRSYFGAPRGLNAKTRRMVSQIADFEIIVTQSELEALLLEMNLIKENRPRYNILLKDDKSYPYIKVTINEEWPRIFSTRNVQEDGARYFGPYANASSVRQTLDLLNRLFAFRPSFACGENKFQRHHRMRKPCLYHDLKRCLGPCVPGLVSKAEYRDAIESVCRFLEGKSDQIVRKLREEMEQAADDLNFERAAYLRDRLRAIEKVLEKQQVLRTVDTDQDVIALAREEGSAVVQVLFIRGGKLIGAEPYTLQGAEDESDGALLASFITQFYNRAPDVPTHLLLADYIEEPKIIESWLAQKGDHKVEIEVPRRGEKRRLIELATQNAQRKLDEMRTQWLNSEQRAVAGLSDLRDRLELTGLPQRIEAYDISNTQGAQSVASMVVFEQGAPKPKSYRRFKIKTVEGANDVASIREVIYRRFKRAADALEGTDEDEQNTERVQDHEEKAAEWATLPDLVLIDGGRGQLNAAYAAMQELGFAHIPVVGVAKGVDRNRFDLVRPNRVALLVLDRNCPALHLVQRIDEEAHRYAITYHRKLRGKVAMTSLLDDVPGIGPKRKKALIKAFGSLDGIRQASIDDLAAVPGMTRKAAEEIKGLL
ncbi:MAG: excinuclease ABC subunit UvrC [Chloroflexaceae bacterium]|nr:excinuclease ABC subunit UvrC [Chloroflexaceae bacterium]